MREVLPALLRLVAGGRRGGAGDRRRHLGVRAPAGRHGHAGGARRDGGRLAVRWLRGGRRLRARRGGARGRRARAAPLRRERRRRPRGRAALRRHPRRPRRPRSPRPRSPGSRSSPPGWTPASPWRWRRSWPPPTPRASAAGCWCPRPGRPRGLSASARLDAAVTDDARGLLAAGLDEVLGYGPDGERRGEGLRVLRHRRSRPAPGCWSSAPASSRRRWSALGAFLGYRVTVCDARPLFATPGPVPRGGRGGRRLAAPLPGRRGGGRPAGRADRRLRPHPRPEVRRARCWPPRCGCRWPTSG